eukprot:13171759-Alexandrium_andersonii.AAC.1
MQCWQLDHDARHTSVTKLIACEVAVTSRNMQQNAAPRRSHSTSAYDPASRRIQGKLPRGHARPRHMKHAQ